MKHISQVLWGLSATNIGKKKPEFLVRQVLEANGHSHSWLATVQQMDGMALFNGKGDCLLAGGRTVTEAVRKLDKLCEV